MAHLSSNGTLIATFQNGEDVYHHAAAEVFGIAPENISPEQHHCAKTINFDFIYDMGQYGLAKSLGIDNLPAKTSIDRCFTRYSGVAEYVQRTKKQAATQDFVGTLFGRHLYPPDTRNKSANARAGTKHAVVNAPIQDTASDFIEHVIIDVSRWLASGNLKNKLVMQMHDGLVLEVPEAGLDSVEKKLPQIMTEVDDGMSKVLPVAEVDVGMN